MPHISKEWEIPAGLTASRSSSMINREIIYRLQIMSNGNEQQKSTSDSHASVPNEADSNEEVTL